MIRHGQARRERREPPACPAPRALQAHGSAATGRPSDGHRGCRRGCDGCARGLRRTFVQGAPQVAFGFIDNFDQSVAREFPHRELRSVELANPLRDLLAGRAGRCS